MTTDDAVMLFAEPPDDAAETGTLYAQVLASTHLLLATDQPVTMDQIGRHVWTRLAEQQRADALPRLLATYITKVQYEAAERVFADAATNPDIGTYLRDGDMAMLWDSYHDTTDPETAVDRRALLNVLSELELLRHRLDQARAETAAGA